MKQQDKEKQTNRRQTLDRLCSGSGLLLSVVCCIALIHVEFRIQEHHRLISHSVTFCISVTFSVTFSLSASAADLAVCFT